MIDYKIRSSRPLFRPAVLRGLNHDLGGSSMQALAEFVTPTANRALARPADSPTVAPAEAATLTMRDRAQSHVARMAGITERVLADLESMEPAHILTQARNLERLDYTARRNYGLGVTTRSMVEDVWTLTSSRPRERSGSGRDH